jgi:glucose-6-phosphate dehydrogenase assembly protein OpcA
MEAAVTVEVLEIDGRAVCHESVVLRVRGAARYHLDSIVRPLTLADLPVFVWVPVHLPVLGDPILAVGDRLLVDTRAAADAETALPHVVKLMRQLPVTDLSWLRLAPWRDQLSGLFQGQVNRPFLAGVDHVTVAGHFAPRHLLAGWLIRRLGLPPEAVSLEDATHVTIRLSARSDGRRGEFTVSRKDDERAIVTEVALQSGPSWAQTLRMRDRWPARALADAITRTGEDTSFATALAGAVTLLS